MTTLRYRIARPLHALAYGVGARANASGWCRTCERHTFWMARAGATACLSCGTDPRPAVRPVATATRRAVTDEAAAERRALRRQLFRLPKFLP